LARVVDPNAARTTLLLQEAVGHHDAKRIGEAHAVLKDLESHEASLEALDDASGVRTRIDLLIASVETGLTDARGFARQNRWVAALRQIDDVLAVEPGNLEALSLRDEARHRSIRVRERLSAARANLSARRPRHALHAIRDARSLEAQLSEADEIERTARWMLWRRTIALALAASAVAACATWAVARGLFA
jgi:hypothetical protein